MTKATTNSNNTHHPNKADHTTASSNTTRANNHSNNIPGTVLQHKADFNTARAPRPTINTTSKVPTVRHSTSNNTRAKLPTTSSPSKAPTLRSSTLRASNLMVKARLVLRATAQPILTTNKKVIVA